MKETFNLDLALSGAKLKTKTGEEVMYFGVHPNPIGDKCYRVILKSGTGFLVNCSGQAGGMTAQGTSDNDIVLDTSTTVNCHAYRLEVMKKAHEEFAIIECAKVGCEDYITLDGVPDWNWANFHYRIKQESERPRRQGYSINIQVFQMATAVDIYDITKGNREHIQSEQYHNNYDKVAWAEIFNNVKSGIQKLAQEKEMTKLCKCTSTCDTLNTNTSEPQEIPVREYRITEAVLEVAGKMLVFDKDDAEIRAAVNNIIQNYKTDPTYPLIDTIDGVNVAEDYEHTFTTVDFIDLMPWESPNLTNKL